MEADGTVLRLKAEHGGPAKLGELGLRQAPSVNHGLRQRPEPPLLRPEPPRSMVGHTERKLHIARGQKVEVPELDGRVMARALALVLGGSLVLHSLRLRHRDRAARS